MEKEAKSQKPEGIEAHIKRSLKELSTLSKPKRYTTESGTVYSPLSNDEGIYQSKGGAIQKTGPMAYTSDSRHKKLRQFHEKKRAEKKVNWDFLVKLVNEGRKENYQGPRGRIMAAIKVTKDEKEQIGMKWSSYVDNINPPFEKLKKPEDKEEDLLSLVDGNSSLDSSPNISLDG